MDGRCKGSSGEKFLRDSRGWAIEERRGGDEGRGGREKEIGDENMESSRNNGRKVMIGGRRLLYWNVAGVARQEIGF